MSYETFSQLEASEKTLLAKINASLFLKGWVLHSGSVYKLTSFEHLVIDTIEDSGTTVNEVLSIASIVNNSYYLDRDNSTLYLRTSDSVNPNGKNIVCIFTNFYSNLSTIAPWNLTTGFDVEWLPIVKDSSQFGVEIDNQIDQIGISIDGKGSISLLNNKTYWADKFDKWYWENNKISIYSWNKDIAITEAKLLFKGTIQAKQYSSDVISFQVADSFFKIRRSFPLDNLGNVGTYPLVYSQTLKRQVYGKVNGLKPQNIDQLVSDIYTIAPANTVSAATATTITFNNPIVYIYFRKDDKIIINSIGEFVVLSVDSTTQLTISTQLSANQQADAVGETAQVKPKSSRNYFNRNWLIAGHALSQPEHTILAIPNRRTLLMDSVEGFRIGHEYFGAFTDSYFLEKTVVTQIIGNNLIFNNPIGETAVIGGTLKMSPLQDVKIDTNEVRLGFGYSVDAVNGKMTLLSEEYIAPRKTLSGSVTFTNGLATVTGVGTKFTSELNDLSVLFPYFGGTTSVQIVEITSDTALRLSTAWSNATVTVSDCEAREIEWFDYRNDTLSCNSLGSTDDGLTTGVLLSRGPEICYDILTKAGMVDDLEPTSFVNESVIADYEIGVVIPIENNMRSSPSVKDVINSINKSIFGIIVQNDEFKLEYKVIRPVKSGTITEFKERDIIGFELSSDGTDIIKEVKVNYDEQEYNADANEKTYSFVTQTSKTGQYLAKSDKSFELDTVINNESDASIIASRLAFYLSFARLSLGIKTKLQGSSAQVGDVFKIDHRFMYERIGLISKIKLGQAMRINKDAFGASIEVDDLGNAFSSVANICDNGSNNYANASVDEILTKGYITDSYGMQSNDSDTHGTNLIW